jgi:hypothetical protein
MRTRGLGEGEREHDGCLRLVAHCTAWFWLDPYQSQVSEPSAILGHINWGRRDVLVTACLRAGRQP